MSGGVDSSVVAGLLHEAGHEVVGVTLQLYDHGAAVSRPGSCCAGQDIHDARRVADRLGIAHYVVDAEERFRRAVIADFADSYARGRTPVPCVRCNQTVKFTDLVALARDLGADALATGHYARRADGSGGPELRRARDLGRDQSWFLFATTREQLAFTRFPLGDMPDKAAVRAHAERMGLPVAAKPDSQDICFVPKGGKDGDYAALVARLRPESAEPGPIVDEDGTERGVHNGIGRYTVGQARRLRGARLADGSPGVVTRIEPDTRRVVIGPRRSGTRDVRVQELNWLIPAPPEPLPCTVKLRAREQPHPATITATTDGAAVRLHAPGLAAPGQACVAYDGDRVLGGGFIA